MSGLNRIKFFSVEDGGALLGIMGNATLNRSGSPISKAAICLAGRIAWARLAHTKPDDEAIPDFAEAATGILLEKHNKTPMGEIGVGIAQIAARNTAITLQSEINATKEKDAPIESIPVIVQQPAVDPPKIPAVTSVLSLPSAKKDTPISADKQHAEPLATVPVLPPSKNKTPDLAIITDRLVAIARVRWRYSAQAGDAAANTAEWQQLKAQMPELTRWFANYHAGRLHNAAQRNIFAGDNQTTLSIALHGYLEQMAANQPNQVLQLQSELK